MKLAPLGELAEGNPHHSVEENDQSGENNHSGENNNSVEDDNTSYHTGDEFPQTCWGTPGENQLQALSGDSQLGKSASTGLLGKEGAVHRHLCRGNNSDSFNTGLGRGTALYSEKQSAPAPAGDVITFGLAEETTIANLSGRSHSQSSWET